MSVLICTTLTTFGMDSYDTWGRWTDNADAISADSPTPVSYFAAIETDHRGQKPFWPLTNHLRNMEQPADWWFFDLDDRRTQVESANRLRHIVTGMNLCAQYAIEEGHEWMLFMGVDCAPPPDAVSALLEMDHWYCGLEVPTFCLKGKVPRYTSWVAGRGTQTEDVYPFPVEVHPVGGACLMLNRDIFSRVRFRTDPQRGLSDDYALAADIDHLFHLSGYTRKDVQCEHYPEHVSPIETRFPGRDMTIHRSL